MQLSVGELLFNQSLSGGIKLAHSDQFTGMTARLIGRLEGRFIDLGEPPAQEIDLVGIIKEMNGLSFFRQDKLNLCFLLLCWYVEMPDKMKPLQSELVERVFGRNLSLLAKLKDLAQKYDGRIFHMCAYCIWSLNKHNFYYFEGTLKDLEKSLSSPTNEKRRIERAVSRARKSPNFDGGPIHTIETKLSELSIYERGGNKVEVGQVIEMITLGNYFHLLQKICMSGWQTERRDFYYKKFFPFTLGVDHSERYAFVAAYRLHWQ